MWVLKNKSFDCQVHCRAKQKIQNHSSYDAFEVVFLISFSKQTKFLVVALFSK